MFSFARRGHTIIHNLMNTEKKKIRTRIRSLALRRGVSGLMYVPNYSQPLQSTPKSFGLAGFLVPWLYASWQFEWVPQKKTLLELIPRAPPPTPPERRNGQVTQRKMVKKPRRKTYEWSWVQWSNHLRMAFAPQRYTKYMTCIFFSFD